MTTSFHIGATCATAWLAPDTVSTTAALEILAALLLLTALAALALVWHIYRQRNALQSARERLREQAHDLAGLQAAARNAGVTETNLREITQHVPVVVFAVRRDADHRRRLAFMAGDTHALFGLARQDLLEPGSDDVLSDWPFGDRIHPEDRARLQQLLRNATKPTPLASLDFRAYGAEGLRWIHLVLTTRRTDDNRLRWIGYFIDTTAINADNQTLRSARDAAERASKAKADFLATMSHEIRTPMNGVIGMLELLGRTDLRAEQRELLRSVTDSASVLLQVLNDILDFSRLESGGLRLDPQPFDPRVLLDSVVALATAALHRKGLQVRTEVDATLAGLLTADSVRIRQILLNLLNNAGKFTEHGSVKVALHVVGDDGHSQHLRFSVADTGIGIPADKQQNLFLPFVQAESWTARRYGGSGLGLSICRHLVDLMNGTLSLASEPGAGTTVTVDVRIPVARREVTCPQGLPGHRALLHMHDPELASALAACLEALGLSVEVLPPDQPPRQGIAADLLFTDQEGAGAAARSISRPIVVTDSPDPSPDTHADTSAMQLSGNPLQWHAVISACEYGLGLQSRPAHDSAAAVATTISSHLRPPGPGERILVAEDHPVSCELIRRQLLTLGWDCDTVGSGRSAYDALCGRTYALLLTDCSMPEMDGFALTTAWRQHEAGDALHHMPVIAMTAHALEEDIARCRAAGMDDYLGKPVRLHPLAEKLAAWLPASTTHAPHAAAVTATPQESPAVLRDRMLRVLVETGRTDMHQLRLAAEAQDGQGTARHLHRLLGGMQTVSNDPVLVDARRVLDLLEGGDTDRGMQNIGACIESLSRLLERMAEAPQSSRTAPDAGI